jgi:RNase P/RNase MRP subunit p30
LLRKRADVVIPDINLKGAQNTAKEIEALGRKSVVIKTDVSNSSDVDRMVKETVDKPEVQISILRQTTIEVNFNKSRKSPAS